MSRTSAALGDGSTPGRDQPFAAAPSEALSGSHDSFLPGLVRSLLRLSLLLIGAAALAFLLSRLVAAEPVDLAFRDALDIP